MEARGIGPDIRQRLFVDNPARAFAFAEVDGGVHDEVLRTSVVGSHAHPGWFVAGSRPPSVVSSGRSISTRCSPTPSISPSATRRMPGSTSISDGEMRRAGFFTAEFYRHLTGVRALPSERRLGAGGHDQQHRFEVLEPIAAPNGLGVVAEFVCGAYADDAPVEGDAARARTRSRDGCAPGPGEVYGSTNRRGRGVRADPAGGATGPRRRWRDDHPGRRAVAGDPSRRPGRLRGAVQRRGRADRGAGAARGASLLRQLPRSAARRRARIGPSSTRCSASGSTSSSSSSPTARWPKWDPAVRDRRGRSRCRRRHHRRQELHLEIGRTTSPADRCGAGAGVPPDRLTLVPDCGFSQTARWATRAKLRALVAGRDLVGPVRIEPATRGGDRDEGPHTSRCSAPG